MSDLLLLYAPIDGWLVLLADGWRLPVVVEPIMAMPHGYYSILLERPA